MQLLRGAEGTQEQGFHSSFLFCLPPSIFSPFNLFCFFFFRSYSHLCFIKFLHNSAPFSPPGSHQCLSLPPSIPPPLYPLPLLPPYRLSSFIIPSILPLSSLTFFYIFFSSVLFIISLFTFLSFYLSFNLFSSFPVSLFLYTLYYPIHTPFIFLSSYRLIHSQCSPYRDFLSTSSAYLFPPSPNLIGVLIRQERPRRRSYMPKFSISSFMWTEKSDSCET